MPNMQTIYKTDRLYRITGKQLWIDVFSYLFIVSCYYFIWFLRWLALIDLLAILRKSLDRATFLYIFVREVRLNGVRASIAIVHIRKFYKIQ